MAKISKISIVHSVSRKFEKALDTCLKACEDSSIEVLDVLSVSASNLVKEIDRDSMS